MHMCVFTRRTPQISEFIYKKLCIYSHMFKSQSPSKYSPFDAIHLWRHFSHSSKQFLNSSIFMPCSASVIFSPLPHWHNVSLWGLFSLGKQTKKVAQGEIGSRGRGRHSGHAVLGQKLLNTQHGFSIETTWKLPADQQCCSLINHPSWNGQTRWVFKKKISEAECSLSQQHQLVHWHRWVPRTLT